MGCKCWAKQNILPDDNQQFDFSYWAWECPQHHLQLSLSSSGLMNFIRSMVWFSRTGGDEGSGLLNLNFPSPWLMWTSCVSDGCCCLTKVWSLWNLGFRKAPKQRANLPSWLFNLNICSDTGVLGSVLYLLFFSFLFSFHALMLCLIVNYWNYMHLVLCFIITELQWLAG